MWCCMLSFPDPILVKWRGLSVRNTLIFIDSHWARSTFIHGPYMAQKAMPAMSAFSSEPARVYHFTKLWLFDLIGRSMSFLAISKPALSSHPQNLASLPLRSPSMVAADGTVALRERSTAQGPKNPSPLKSPFSVFQSTPTLVRL